MKTIILAAALAALSLPALAADPALTNVQVAARNLGNLAKADVSSFVNEVKVTGGLGTTTNVGVTALGVSANQQITGAVNMIIAGPTFPGTILH